MTHPPAPWWFWDQPSKAKKWAVAQFLEIPTPSPKQLEKSSHSLAYEITQLIKANPIFWASCFLRWPTLSVECISPKATLAPSDRPHSIYGMCTSLNKTTSCPSLRFSLNSFCNETSRTWASLCPETKCETVSTSRDLSYMVSASGFIIWQTEHRIHLSWNWKTQILSEERIFQKQNHIYLTGIFI